MEVDIENQSENMENAPVSFKAPSMPGTPQPLQPISPERQNQQRLPQSPSLSFSLDGNTSPRKSHQPRLSDASDVKARVAYLNAVAQSGSPTRSTSPPKPHALGTNYAAIQRAVLGREEAEGALTGITAQLESAKARERMVSERVESLMEQLSETRNRQRHERAVYEKEIKQSKKTEYKAELAVIKLQEDLREARSELETSKARTDHERAEKDKARQEAFERAYVVAGMTEEIQDLKQRLEVMEQERDTAVAATASRIELQEQVNQKEARNEMSTGEKRKQPMSDFDTFFYDELDLQAPDCPIEIKFAALKKENGLLRRQVQEGQETIHFMNMQCQFKACPCRLAESDGVRFVHDYEYDAKVRAQNAKKRKAEEIEPQLPLPTFKSWRQKQDERKGKQPVRREELNSQTEVVKSKHDTTDVRQEDARIEAMEIEPVESTDAPLPPVEAPLHGLGDSEPGSILEDAINVPLPSLKPMEIDPSDDTPEPTAQLEELTQVIVQTGDSAQDFLFSASTTSNRATPGIIPALQQSHTLPMPDDLFDISPPKRQIPPRPSTAMGVLTVESPVRLVPDSPQAAQQRALTPSFDMPQLMTTRVALNDTSPVRQARQHRQPTRPDMTERQRGHSPALSRASEVDRSSPAPSTLFPITPAPKNERQIRKTQDPVRPQTTQDYYPTNNDMKEVSTTTTTTVPLRPEPEEHQEASTTAPFSVPGTPNMTREQALAQIRARRDRARSINMRRTAEEGGSKTPGSAARRGVNLKDRLQGEAVRGRDFSQASAPGRI